MKKLKLRRADNLRTAQLIKLMSENYETYNIILKEIINNNCDFAVEYLENLKGIEFHNYTFGSVFINDYEAEITSIEEFLNNNFNSDNDNFYKLLNELEKDKNNVKLQKELLDMLFNEEDSNATLENYYLEEIVCYESDTFDNWLNHYEMVVDMDSYKLYSSYDLEELGIDYQDLD